MFGEDWNQWYYLVPGWQMAWLHFSWLHLWRLVNPNLAGNPHKWRENANLIAPSWPRSEMRSNNLFRAIIFPLLLSGRHQLSSQRRRGLQGWNITLIKRKMPHTWGIASTPTHYLLEAKTRSPKITTSKLAAIIHRTSRRRRRVALVISWKERAFWWREDFDTVTGCWRPGGYVKLLSASALARLLQGRPAMFYETTWMSRCRHQP